MTTATAKKNVRKRTPEEQALYDQVQELRAKRAALSNEKKEKLSGFDAFTLETPASTKAAAVDTYLACRDAVDRLDAEISAKDAEYRKLRGEA